MTKRYIPRWLYTEAMVQDTWIKIPPGTLQNNTIFPFQLEHLVVAAPASCSGFTIQGYAGAGDQIIAELGVSQEGGINSVPAMLNGVFSTTVPMNLSWITGGATVELRYPYRLSRDNGFYVRWRRRLDMYAGGDWSTKEFNNQGIVLRGYDIQTGKPVILGATNENRSTTNVSEVTFDGADLRNRGVHDIDIRSITFPRLLNYPPGYNAAGGGAITTPFAMNQAYSINPVVGERWMPGDTEIPVACLAPYAVGGAFDQFNNLGVKSRDWGPYTFVFPEGTYLYRRQDIGLRLAQSFYAYTIPVHVALFGYLEVE